MTALPASSRTSSAVLLTALACLACERPRLIEALPPDLRIDTYIQQAASKIDVLWVVDNSGSMAPRQDNIARNFQAFMEAFTKNAIDYRLAVTTTDIFRDRGKLVGTPKVISPQTPNPITAFGNNVKVGIMGSPYEAGLEAARLAIELQKTENADLLSRCKASCRMGDTNCTNSCETRLAYPFLRDDAYLYLIFVTDEEDRSDYDVRYYYRYFETAKGIGNDGTVTTAAIMGPRANTCSATEGKRYQSMSDLTGGEVGSICDQNFSTTLRKLANNAVGLKRKFQLQLKPAVNTLEVHVRYACNSTDQDSLRACAKIDRTQCEGNPGDSMNQICTAVQGGPDGWSFEPANNVIFFAGNSVPGLKSQIELRYYEEGNEP